MYLPVDIIRHIDSFLCKCEVCRLPYEQPSLIICVFCKRGWCGRCLDNTQFSYVGYHYFETMLPACKSCIADLRYPRYSFLTQ